MRRGVGGVFVDSIQLHSVEARLAGQQPARPGDTVQVSLGWQALAAPAANYAVSLQLLGPGGDLVASADRTPGNGFRPTTGWQVGEQINDRLALSLPADAAPGVYQLLAVLYDPATGQRLPVHHDGVADSDHLLLLELPVEQ